MSSVVQTQAAVNKVDPSSYTYNPDGKPYTWDKLDSINVDFKPELTFSSVNEQDWDFKLGYLKTTCNHKGNTTYEDWTAYQGDDIKNIGILRIHATMNIGAPYKERSEEYRDKDENGNLLPDILWGRIESEPMLFYPDRTVGHTTTNMNAVMGLSSVRQIIINVKESNYNDGENKYRPLVLFYDGPETYDMYREESEKEHVRDALPVILNLNAPFRGILYTPYSPVVVIGEAQDSFRGFVVAKEYLRLKTTKDFEDELKADSGKYTRDNNDNFTATKAVKNPYYVADRNNYADGYEAEPEMIKWKYTKIVENGIEMYVDNYGNVQYMDYPDAPVSCGYYDAFGRTEFTTHDYEIMKTSTANLLLSGK